MSLESEIKEKYVFNLDELFKLGFFKSSDGRYLRIIGENGLETAREISTGKYKIFLIREDDPYAKSLDEHLF